MLTNLNKTDSLKEPKITKNLKYFVETSLC